jgi:tetratricopeptide (TPR) repeat protein
MLWPVDLAVIYPHPRSGLPAWQPVAAALLLLGLSAVVVHQGGRRPWLPVGWLFYLVTLLPVSGIVQVGYHARADRFTYVPLIGVLVAIVWTLGDGVAGRGAARRPPHLLVALVVAACVALTWRQLGHWRTSVDLFSHVVAVTTDNSRAHYNLGTALEELGDTEGAATHFRETIRIEPGFAEAHFNLTRITMRRGDLDAAAALAREERERWPTHPHTYVDLGAVAALQGRDEEAIRWFEEALRLDPESGDARHNLEVLRARQGLPTSSGVR